MGKKKCFFTCFYRSPSQKSFDKFDTFYFNLNLFLSNINDLNRASSVLIDDFNAGTFEMQKTFESRAIHSLTTLAEYSHPVHQPTHVTGNSSSCFDLVFASTLPPPG